MINQQWENNIENYIVGFNINNFRKNKANHKLSLWNPENNGVRYLKDLIYNLCSQLTAQQWKYLRNIHNRNLGSPITVKYHGEAVDLDYLQVVYEIEFLYKNNIPLPLNIIEIGAGYGRTCHGFLSNQTFANRINNYYILDLPECMKLSKEYLQNVLIESDYNKVQFYSDPQLVFNKLSRAWDFPPNQVNNLCISIDAFSEFNVLTIQKYLSYIDKTCDYFYLKGPISKYHDPSLTTSVNKQEKEYAMRTGLKNRILLDTHDQEDIYNNIEGFIDIHRPSSSWSIVNNDWAPPFSFYWQALYAK